MDGPFIGKERGVGLAMVRPNLMQAEKQTLVSKHYDATLRYFVIM